MLSKFKIYFPSPIHMYTGFPSPTQKYKKKATRQRNDYSRGKMREKLETYKIKCIRIFFYGWCFYCFIL